MNAYDVFAGYFLLIRQNLEIDKFGDKIAGIDLDVATARPLLISGICSVRTRSVVPPMVFSVRFKMWGDAVNRRRLIAAILNLLKLNLLKLNLGKK